MDPKKKRKVCGKADKFELGLLRWKCKKYSNSDSYKENEGMPRGKVVLKM